MAAKKKPVKPDVTIPNIPVDDHKNVRAFELGAAIYHHFKTHPTDLKKFAKQGEVTLLAAKESPASGVPIVGRPGKPGKTKK